MRRVRRAVGVALVLVGVVVLSYQAGQRSVTPPMWLTQDGPRIYLNQEDHGTNDGFGRQTCLNCPEVTNVKLVGDIHGVLVRVEGSGAER